MVAATTTKTATVVEAVHKEGPPTAVTTIHTTEVVDLREAIHMVETAAATTIRTVAAAGPKVETRMGVIMTPTVVEVDRKAATRTAAETTTTTHTEVAVVLKAAHPMEKVVTTTLMAARAGTTTAAMTTTTARNNTTKAVTTTVAVTHALADLVRHTVDRMTSPEHSSKPANTQATPLTTTCSAMSWAC
jgi:hypothetical protein